MFVLLGICILLAALLALNSVTSLCAEALWRVARGFTHQWPAAPRARILFLLRALPAAVSVCCVLFVVAPAYLEMEPRSTTESVSLKLAIIALASAVGIGLAVIRSVASWRATARLAADWLAHAEPVSIPGVSIPAFRIEHEFPVIAVVGILRPRLFIGNQIFESLTAAEIAAAVEHEAGHLLARDNLKHGVLRACRDAMLIIPSGRALDAAWAEVSESAADEHAALRGSAVALDLASALIKISRMIPAGVKPAMPAGAFLISDGGSPGVTTRVRRLVQIASGDGKPELCGPLIAKLLVWIFPVLLLLLGMTAQGSPRFLAAVHSLIERVVSLLS